MTILRTGIDLIEISRLEDLNPSIRQRFLERVFTPMELQQIGTFHSQPCRAVCRQGGGRQGAGNRHRGHQLAGN